MTMLAGKVTIRSGSKFARGTSIDAVLDSQEDVQAIYERWDKAWGEQIDCGGGIFSITCEMVCAAPYADLVAVYGKRRMERIYPIVINFNTV